MGKAFFVRFVKRIQNILIGLQKSAIIITVVRFYGNYFKVATA